MRSQPGNACALAWLSVTFLLGLGFVAMKISELYGMAVAGAGPWRAAVFSRRCFTLVGTHGAHVSVGLVWIVLLGCEVALRAEPFVASRLCRLGLFWHFLDIVWINIFSVVYLPGIL